jgi:hypothetical protein
MVRCDGWGAKPAKRRPSYATVRRTPLMVADLPQKERA